MKKRKSKVPEEEKEKEKENIPENEGEEEAAEFVQNKYAPTLSSRIVCVELENNQKIYLNYTEKTTIKDLINTIINRREYKMLNFNRDNILSSPYFTSSYDLNLSFYDDIKPPYENKMSLDAQIDDLHNQGILKSHRTAFLIFKDNYIPFSYIYSKEKYNEEIKKIKENNNNQLAKYYNYLPRQIKYIPNLFIAHPELENYYSHNKKGYNEFNAYRRNKLTCEDEKIDWLIYDKESINFLLKMNKINLEEMSFLKYKDGIVYFEDKCKVDDGRKSYSSTLKNQRLTDEKLKKVFANLTIDTAKPGQNSNLVANKMKVDTSTTAKDLIEKMCKKLNSIKKDLNIDTESKILKVKSLNDYIFDINEPLINYTYFNECVKLNKTPEYLIIDNPFITEVSEDAMNQIYGDNTKQSLFSSLKGDNLRGSSIRRVTLSSSMPTPINKGKNALENIAFYDKNKDENIKGVNVKADLEKIVNKSSKSTSAPAPTPKKGGGTGDINSLIDLLVKEVDQNIQSQSKTNNSSTKNVIKEINNNEIKPKKLNNKSIKSNHLFLDLNPNGSEYFSSRKRYRNRQPKLEKNIFKNDEVVEKTEKNNKTKKNKETPIQPENNKKKIHQLINKTSINLENVDRQFNIIFRSAYINQVFNSVEYETKNVKTVLLFKFELYCSSHPIGTSKQIRWKTNTKVQNPIFNKRIYFDRNYDKLPNCCSLLIKVKFIQYDKSNQVYKNSTVFWANYRLFDEDNKLKVGLQKVNLQDRAVADDIYYCFSDNPNEENSSKIYFEIENFANPIQYKLNILPELKKIVIEPCLYEVPDKDIRMLTLIDEKSLFEELNNNEKNILWANRLGAPRISKSLIPRLLQSCNYKNPNTNKELQKVFSTIPNLRIVEAIELLSGRYTNELIREFAVSFLKRESFEEISHYLLQLIQALKYEKNVDNPLGIFLLEQAIIHPITVGHEFFWHLRAEMYNPDVQKKYGLYLEVFLNKISGALYDIFKDEDYLLKELIDIAINVKKKIPKEERDKIFRQDLEKINAELNSKKKEISLPLNFKYRIKGIFADRCRIMKSKKKPLWLTFQNSDPMGEDIVVMLKCGDDLRMDMVTIQLFKAMQTLWFDNNLKLKMSLYKVLCTGNQQGMLEMVTNAETLAAIHVKEGGAISQFFSKAPIKNWIEQNKANVSMEDAIENFLLSNVAYCLATFVLGIGDRHNDNIMIKKNGELFHIDFGHFLGHFKSKMGIKRERAPFVFTRQFQNVLGDDNSPLFLDFKDKLAKGYTILRANKGAIVTLLRILLCTGIPELDEKSLRFLEGTLAMKKKQKEALVYLNKQLADSLDSVSTKLNFAIHIVANK
jgi:hypothetical protein